MSSHRTDVVSLAFGLIFTLVAILSLVDALDLSGSAVRWIGAALLVTFGVVLLATARAGRSDARDIS